MLLLNRHHSTKTQTSHWGHHSYKQHVLHIYRKPRGFHKAKPHLLLTSFHDRISRQLNPEELSGWSFQSWHGKHTDIDLAASPSAFCPYTFLQQHDCHQPNSPRSCISSPLLADWDCEKVLADGPSVTLPPIKRQNLPVKLLHRITELKLCMICWLSNREPALNRLTSGNIIWLNTSTPKFYTKVDKNGCAVAYGYALVGGIST